ncbi:MAG TPA: ATP-binding protein [Gemmatimonadaceae bacterium]|nr:ATP-binding protein [Gemmatimonadaceae bacterium]
MKQTVTSWIAPTVFEGPGEMAVLCREFPWEKTSLGPVHKWPLSLRTIVNALLNSRHPMFLFWGPELVQFYNDAYRPSFAEGPRHPAALGAKAQNFWTEIWDVIGPQIEGVMQRGEATWYEDQFLPILRNGQMEDVYWTYSYSPVRDDDGNINGTLVICQETTASVQTRAEIEKARDSAARLQRVTARLAAVNTAEQVASVVTSEGMEATGARTSAIFARLVGDREQLVMLGSAGLPKEISGQYAAFTGSANTPGAAVVRSGEPIFFENRKDLYNSFPEVVHVWEAVGSQAAAIMPLIIGGECTGAVSFTYDTPRTFAPEDRNFFLALASQCAQALERARLFEAEREARAQAQAASKGKSEFLAVMSHELRTPLNAIGGYAELMEIGVHGPITPDQRKALERIQMSQRHLLGLINAVLNYTRVEAGNVSYNCEAVPVGEALSSCEALTSPQMQSKGLTLKAEPSEPSLTVYADREKLQQIVLNLLTNSMKFTQPGGVVTLSCVANDGHIDIMVGDNGRGIEPDHLERIFEPFVQVDARLTRTQEGVGLGLAISRDLARGMGGDLLVESAAGEGSMFTLRMPATSPAA